MSTNEKSLTCKAYFEDGEYRLFLIRENVCVAAFSYSDAALVLDDFKRFSSRGHWSCFKNTKNDVALVENYNSRYVDPEYIPDPCFAVCYGTNISVYPSELRRLKDYDYFWNCWVALVSVIHIPRLECH